MAPATWGPARPAMPVNDAFLGQPEPPWIGARQADGQDGDRNGSLHHLAHLEARVRGGYREDHAQEQPPAHRTASEFGEGGGGGNRGSINRAGRQRLVGVLREGGSCGGGGQDRIVIDLTATA